MAAPTFTPGDKKQGEQLNPHQQDYNRRFNDAQNSRPEYPDVEKGLRDLENFSKDSAEDVDKSIAEREDEGSPQGSWKDNTTTGAPAALTLQQRAIRILKKRGGAIGLLGGLGVGGILLASLFAPASMLVNLMENLSDTNDSSSTSMERRFMKAFGFSTKDSDPVCSNSSKNIKCKMGRISNKALEQLTKKGMTPYFDADATNTDTKKGYPSRNPRGYTIEMGDGTSRNVASGDLPGFLANNPKFAAKVLGTGGAFNLRLKAWSGKHISQKLYKKFNISRTGGLADGSHKQGNRAAETLAKLKEKLPGLEKLDGVKDRIGTKITGQIGKAKKGGVGYTLAVASCVGIKAPGYIAAGVAAIQLARIISVAHDTILSPGAKLKASAVETNETAITTEDLDSIGTILTERTPEEGSDQLSSALDSAILLSALGVNRNKPAVAKDLTPGYSMFSNPLIQAAEGADKQTESACNAIMSPAAMWAAFAVDSAVTVAASATVVGGLAKIVAGWAISEIIVGVTEGIVKNLAGTVITDLAKNDKIETARGKELGDVMGISALSFFSAGGMARNLPVLKQSQLAEYSEIKEENEAFNKQMAVASLSPFDISSKYTFLGSIVNNTRLAYMANGNTVSPFSIAATISNLITPKNLIASAASQTENSCGYAEDFFLETTDPADTPAINAAGLPCTGLTADQAAMSTNEALDLVVSEGWLDESKTFKDDATIEDLVKSGYIKSETPLTDFIESCSDASTGDYLVNSAGCTVNSTTKDSDSVNDSVGGVCTTGEESVCVSDEYDGGDAVEGVKNPRSLSAISTFLLDFQTIQSVNGEDEETAKGGSTSALVGRPDGAIDKGQGWVLADGVDYSQYECDPRTEDAGPFTNATYGFTVRLCVISFNTPTTWADDGGNSVASVVSTNVMNMFEAARAEGVELGLSDGMRKTSAASYSNHKFGLALDLGTPRGGQTICYGGDPASGYGSAANAEAACRSRGGQHYQAYQWLQANAATYGFFNLTTEPWHWDTVGG